jgi:tetratricopeptide (TPR) repeat protein
LEENVDVRGIGLAGLTALSLCLAGAASAQNPAHDTIELALAAPPAPRVERCLHPRGAADSLVVAACTDALDAGLDGPDKALALVHRGNARRSLGDDTGAKSDLLLAADQYGSLISDSSPQPAMIYARATIWHALGEADRALADYDRAARLDPNNPMIFLNRGILLVRYKADYALAVIDFEQALQLEPRDPEVRRRAMAERAAALAVTRAASR